MLCVMNIAAGAGTLPMPRDNVYPFKGPMLGNDATCTTQGFFFNFAQQCSFPCKNAWLAIYYVCVLVLKLKPRTISRYIEPFFYLISLVTSIAGSWIFLKYEYFNVDPLMTHCFTARYPFHCTWIPDGEECYDNGSSLYTEAGYNVLNLVTLYYMGVVFGLLILCMLAIIINTYFFERRMKVRRTSSEVQESNTTSSRTGQGNNSAKASASLDTNSRTIEANTSKDSYTSLVAFQATLYILTFFIAYIPSTIALAVEGVEEGGAGVYSRIFLQSFEGFFILCIFLYHKVYNIRRFKKRTNISMREALSLIFFSREHNGDVFLENFTMVQEEIEDVRERRAAKMNAANEIEADEFTDDKIGSVELEKYEGISFASPEVSYNLDEGVSSSGMSFAPDVSLPSNSTSGPKHYEYRNQGEESISMGISLPSDFASGPT